MALIIYAFTVVMSNAIIVWQKKKCTGQQWTRKERGKCVLKSVENLFQTLGMFDRVIQE